MMLQAIRTRRLNKARTVSQYLIKRCNTELSQPDHVSSEPVEKNTKPPGLRSQKDPAFSYKPWKHLDENPIEKYLSPEYTVDAHLDEKGHANGPLPMWGDEVIPLRFRDSLAHYKTQFLVKVSFWQLLPIHGTLALLIADRDHCRCEKCVNQDTMQRAFDTFSIPHNIRPKTVVTEKKGLRVTWANDDHISFYRWEWLFTWRTTKGPTVWDKHRYPFAHKRWDAKTLQHPPSVSYAEIMADNNGVAKWTQNIRLFGFCYVDGCPTSADKTQELLEKIAFIRTTHYGGFYDFTSDLTMKDTAYTSLALGAHTDTTYFSDPAGLQMFHLLSHTDGAGGASLLIDGFNAARILKEESPESWQTLCEIPLSWHASGNEGITIIPQKRYPVLSLGPSPSTPYGSSSFLMQVRWNNDDRGTINLGGGKPEKWYSAARKFDEILKRESSQYWAQLEPGRPLIFDNWRVLHGRSAFTGKRRMCGGYINHDDFISRWRNTNYTREEALSQIL